MANYSKCITSGGLALLDYISNAGGTLVWTQVKAGDGAIGTTDPATLTDVISSKQVFSAVDVKLDGNGQPYVFFNLDNDGLSTGYTRREVGIYGKKQGATSDALIIYLYAANDTDADYVPPESNGIASVQTFRAQIAEAAGLTASVSIDHSTVFLALDRWADHLAGAGGADQHPAASTSAPGLMIAADKSKLDAHVNPSTPTSGADIHANATQSVPGFMPAADKAKLDGIAAGAEVNLNNFGIIKVGSTNLLPDAKADLLELAGGAYISITPDADNDKVTIEAQNITPSSHIGSNGSVHAVATQAVAGFESAADKTKLDGIQAGAEVNQLAFSNVKVGSTILAADSKTDTLELAAGSGLMITPDAASDLATIGLALPYYSIKTNYAAGVTPAQILSHADTISAGIRVAPRGGLVYLSYYPNYSAGNLSMLEMRINNKSGSSINKTIRIGGIADYLYYQIDSGAITQLQAGYTDKIDATISIPAGIHTLRWYISNSADRACATIADFLDDTVVWAAGGTYY